MVLTILFILKIILFIKLTGIQYNQAIIFTVSTLFTLFAFTLIYFSRNKKKQSIAFSFYNIMSAIMFADAVYYHYFNNLPSIIMFKQLGAVAQVGDSVRAVINPLHLLFIADIPFLFVYSSKKKKKIKKSTKVYEKKIRIGVPSLLALTLAIVITVLSIGGYGTVLGRQELFTYHAKDFASLFRSESAKGEGEFTEEDLAYLRKRAMVDNGKLTGIGKGKNLLVIQVEGLQNFVINEYYDGQEVTPNLNSFIKDNSSIYFDRYYQLLGRGNTSDAEFVSNNSLYPSMEDPTYTQYQDITFYGLPWILRDNGYTSWVFHGYKKEFWNRSAAYPNQGFERFISGEDYNVGETIALGLSDKDFFKQSLPYLKEMEKPFHAFMITLSSHTPFTMPEKYHVIKLRPEHKDTMFGNYLQAIHYTDEAIGEFIESLKKEGLYDDTVIAIYGDHFALSSMDEANEKIMTDYLGYQYDYDSMMNIPLIIHVPGEDINETVSKVSCQLDFLPTILNIMGVKNEKGVMFGKDILNTEDSFVAQQTYMLKGSFIDNEKVFVMSRDGVYKHSRAYYLDTREPVDLEKCKENYNRAIEEINKSNYVLRQGGRFFLSQNLHK
ncbi:MAG: Phosphoglycerol transferase MdoB [Sporanaerobacter sp.]|jgi:lipoteichoic acid synthase|uniref:LTA synthase family protein n=1 Tax=Sporanaerobacter sp. TaxID=2010183 RepID=UPI003A1016E8